jgi:amino acid transporter
MNKSLNDFTNITTVILFILYSILKRFDLNQTLVVILAIAWVINLSLIIYLIYKIIKDKETMEKSTKNWLYFRTIANLGFIYLTLSLI